MVRETTHGLLRRDAFEKGEVVHVNCPCCKKRLFDLEMDSEVGNETIRIKCSRCKGVATVRLKNCNRESIFTVA